MTKSDKQRVEGHISRARYWVEHFGDWIVRERFQEALDIASDNLRKAEMILKEGSIQK